MPQREGGTVSATACHNAFVSCVRMRRPASCDSGDPGVIPRFSITEASLLRGVPSMYSITRTRRLARPCMGSGTPTAGSHALPSAWCETEA